MAQLLTMLSLSVYAAQLPELSRIFGLSNTQAGWIGAAYFAGYTLTVPVLVSLTDRIDPKRVYMLGSALLVLGCLLFATQAQGAWSAALFHAIAGAGLAGTYMPGLKGLVDHMDDAYHSRAVAYYTASFGLGAGASYPFSAYLGDSLGWQAAFVGTAVSAALAGVLVCLLLPAARPEALNIASTRLLDFRPVLRNRAALAYTMGYAMHCWELFGMRTWVVAYLVYAERLHGAAPGLLSPAIVAALLTFIGVPASIIGNEWSMRFGRLRVICLIMTASAVVCGVMGFAAEISYWAAVIMCLIHGIVVILDSASLTAGALGNADPGYRGATMAVHAMLGFGGATLGPLAFGWLLDLSGGQSFAGWWVAFMHMGLVQIAGIVILVLLKPPPVTGDRR
ncbi:MAG: MFS transporter [Methyloligellaceae bacterium]